MFGQLVGPDIVEMLRERQFSDLRRALVAIPAVSVAEIFEDMDPTDVAILFRILPRDFAADVFEYLPFDAQEPLLRLLGNEHVAAVLNQMAPDDRTTLLEELPGQVAQRLISLLTPEERQIAITLLGYPEDSVGRRMTPDYVAVRSNWTVGQVLDHIRQVGHDKETLNVIYVVDDHGRLIDDVRLRELVLSSPTTPLSQILDGQVFSLNVSQDQEEAVHAFQDQDRTALPVVDSTGTLVGIVTVDDIMDVAEEEVTEDIQKMAAVEALDKPYMDVALPQMVRKRGVWLSVLFIGEMFTATAMGYFEYEIERAAVLAMFIPLIISSGGNSGSQAASIIIRSLALGEVTVREWFRVMWRELASGVALGALLGSIAFGRIVLWAIMHAKMFPLRKPLYGDHYVLLAVTVFMTLIGVVTFGTLAGSMLPIIMKRLKLDPAASSAPFVATLVDVTGIVIYFTMAMLILRGTILKTEEAPPPAETQPATTYHSYDSAPAPLDPLVRDAALADNVRSWTALTSWRVS